MDLPVCLLLASMLLVIVQADPTDQGPQTFSNPPIEEKPLEEKKQHKRQPKFEEVILYLTPSQIRAYESGKGLLTRQQAASLRAIEEGRGLITPPLIQHGAPVGGQKIDLPHQTSQFRGSEAGQGFFKTNEHAKFPALQVLEPRLEEPQKTVQSPQAETMDLSKMNNKLKEMQNSLNEAGQKLQNEVKLLENMTKEHMQTDDSKKNKSTKETSSQQLAPENNAPQTPRLELKKREKYIELPVPVQFLPQEWSHVHQNYPAPIEVPHLRQQFIAPPVPQLEQHLIPTAGPQLIHFPIRHDKPELAPKNYAYLYFYPNGKSVNNEELPIFFPPKEPKHQYPKELFVHPEPPLNLQLHPRFQLLPYEYASQNKLEAQQILQTQLQDHNLDAQRLDAHKLDAHQIEDFDAQQLLIQKHLEPHYQHEKLHFEEPKYQPQEIKLKIIPHTAALQAQTPKEIKVDLKNLNGFQKKEIMEVYVAQKFKSKAEKEEKEAHRLDAQLKQEELKAEQFKAEQINEGLLKSQEFKDELFKSEELTGAFLNNQKFKNELLKNQEFHDELLKNQELGRETVKNQEWKEELLKNEDLKEMLRNEGYNEEPNKSQEFTEITSKQEYKNEEVFKNQDLGNIFKSNEYKEELFKSQEFQENPIKNPEIQEDIFKSQLSQDELYKSEYQDLGYLQKLEPKRTLMYSILNPLFQGHSITESLQQQKASFPHHKIHLENGFKPLQYAPKFNDEKYAREVEKMLKRNRVEKQKALAKAAAIANEPPEIIHSEEKVLMDPVVRHIEVPVPTPVMVPVPTPIEVKVPQPYPVEVEIIKPFPVSIIKTEKVEVEKPIPIEIEKRVPIPIKKNVYVKVDKPYFVPKVVPVEVKREIPVEVPVKLKTPLRFSIIKHVWNR